MPNDQPKITEGELFVRDLRFAIVAARFNDFVVEPLVRGALDALKRHGITRIEAQGQPFDPNQHQAVMQQPSDQPDNSVLQVLEHGYMLHDRVLRPARVIVSTAASGTLTKSE